MGPKAPDAPGPRGSFCTCSSFPTAITPWKNAPGKGPVVPLSDRSARRRNGRAELSSFPERPGGYASAEKGLDPLGQIRLRQGTDYALSLLPLPEENEGRHTPDTEPGGMGLFACGIDLVDDELA